MEPFFFLCLLAVIQTAVNGNPAIDRAPPITYQTLNVTANPPPLAPILSKSNSRRGYKRDLLVVLPVMQGSSDLTDSNLQMLYTKTPVTAIINDHSSAPTYSVRKPTAAAVKSSTPTSVYGTSTSSTTLLPMSASIATQPQGLETTVSTTSAEFRHPYTNFLLSTKPDLNVPKSPLDYGYPNSFKFVQELNELPKNHKPVWAQSETAAAEAQTKRPSTAESTTKNDPFQMFESVKPLDINKLLSVKPAMVLVTETDAVDESTLNKKEESTAKVPAPLKRPSKKPSKVKINHQKPTTDASTPPNVLLADKTGFPATQISTVKVSSAATESMTSPVLSSSTTIPQTTSPRSGSTKLDEELYDAVRYSTLLSESAKEFLPAPPASAPHVSNRTTSKTHPAKIISTFAALPPDTWLPMTSPPVTAIAGATPLSSATASSLFTSSATASSFFASSTAAQSAASTSSTAHSFTSPSSSSTRKTPYRTTFNRISSSSRTTTTEYTTINPTTTTSATSSPDFAWFNNAATPTAQIPQTYLLPTAAPQLKASDLISLTNILENSLNVSAGDIKLSTTAKPAFSADMLPVDMKKMLISLGILKSENDSTPLLFSSTDTPASSTAQQFFDSFFIEREPVTPAIDPHSYVSFKKLTIDDEPARMNNDMRDLLSSFGLLPTAKVNNVRTNSILTRISRQHKKTNHSDPLAEMLDGNMRDTLQNLGLLKPMAYSHQLNRSGHVFQPSIHLEKLVNPQQAEKINSALETIRELSKSEDAQNLPIEELEQKFRNVTALLRDENFLGVNETDTSQPPDQTASTVRNIIFYNATTPEIMASGVNKTSTTFSTRPTESSASTDASLKSSPATTVSSAADVGRGGGGSSTRRSVASTDRIASVSPASEKISTSARTSASISSAGASSSTTSRSAAASSARQSVTTVSFGIKNTSPSTTSRKVVATNTFYQSTVPSTSTSRSFATNSPYTQITVPSTSSKSTVPSPSSQSTDPSPSSPSATPTSVSSTNISPSSPPVATTTVTRENEGGDSIVESYSAVDESSGIFTEKGSLDTITALPQTSTDALPEEQNEINYTPVASSMSVIKVASSANNNNNDSANVLMPPPPNPLSIEELQSLLESNRNDVKRQQPTEKSSTTTSSTTATTVENGTQISGAGTDKSNSSMGDSLSSESSNAVTPVETSNKEESSSNNNNNNNNNNNDDNNAPLEALADSFGGETESEQGNSWAANAKPNGLYFLLDWNTFLSVGEEDKNPIRIRFSPRAGNPRHFLPIKVP